jgi:hypothetical protein
VGGACIGLPRHTNKYKNCIDIRRMALIDACPTNSESYFLGKILSWIKKHTNFQQVLSYSDLSVGHIGTIYMASNFRLIGETAPTKHVVWQGKLYHPRSLTIDRPYSYLLRDAIKNGEAKILIGKPKLIWIYDIHRKTKRNRMGKNYHF